MPANQSETNFQTRSNEEAFIVASRRLGAPDKLITEYGKVNGTYVWRKRLIWILLGWVCGNALQSAVGGIAVMASVAVAFSGLGSFSVGIASVVTTLICWMIVVFAVWQHGWKAKAVATSSTVFSGGLVSLIALLVIGQVLAMVGMNIHANVVHGKEFGETLVWASIGGKTIYFFVFAACVAIIAILGHSQVEEAREMG